MGNVYASSQQPPSPSLGVPSYKTDKPTSEESQTLENPGPLEELHRKCKGRISILTYLFQNFKI